MPIRKLPLLLINQIAAGEVIERPASVVKELVENSLDAHATQIDVQIENGGRQLIRISDNGTGIPENELPLAIDAHATSKLQTVDQLEAISTMGFRGEAIASIASVSRLRITSKATLNGVACESGATLEVHGGQIQPLAPAACAPGTTLEVKNLFFNTPARLKFMRAASTEFGHISDIISRIAMVQPHVGFTLTHNGRKTIDVSPDTSHRRRCIQLLGKQLDEAMLEFEHVDLPTEGASPDSPPVSPPPRLWGLAGLPDIARATTKFQYVFINGRPIKDRSLNHAIKEAYRGLIPHDRHPVAVLCLEIDPATVDVNVHPTKAQVRFREPSRMHGLILHALRQCLLANDLTPQVSFADNARTAQSGGLRFSRPTETTNPTATNPTAFMQHFREMDSTQKGFIYEQIKQALPPPPEASEVFPPPPHEWLPQNSNAPASGNNPESLSELPGAGAWELAQRNSPGGAPPQPVLQQYNILQVHNSYLVTQDDKGILIIDQHALHERVMFEQLRERILGQNKNHESQRLLMPATMVASPGRLDLAEQLKPLFDRIGIDAQPIGKESLAIHAFPTLLFDRKVDPIAFVEELLDEAEEGKLDLANPTLDEAVLHKVLDMMACKAAVKGGDAMTQAELAALLAKRDEIERSSNCPHGRPTSLRLSLQDLEKQFMRT